MNNESTSNNVFFNELYVDNAKIGIEFFILVQNHMMNKIIITAKMINIIPVAII